MRFIATALVLGWFTVIASAKAPGTPAMPETEFKVLPSSAQEFFASDPSPIQSAFTPVTAIAQPADAFAAMGGSAVGMAWTTLEKRLKAVPSNYLLHFHRKWL